MKRLSTWLIIFGIALLLIPVSGNLYVKYSQDKLYKEYLAQLEATQQEKSNQSTLNGNHSQGEIPIINTHDSVDVMEQSFSEAIAETEESSKKEADKKPTLNTIGRIVIDDIDVDLILLEGSSQTNLIYGAGHMAETAYPGETGNCAIAGHRGYTFGTYFYRLDELEAGDIITINYNNSDYRYSVDESFLILPTQVEILKQPKDKKQLTLITCDPPVVGSHRLVVKASLVEDN